VKEKNDKNDLLIKELQGEKDKAKTKKVRSEKAKRIATIQREKTTRNRRLRDRERFQI